MRLGTHHKRFRKKWHIRLKREQQVEHDRSPGEEEEHSDQTTPLWDKNRWEDVLDWLTNSETRKRHASNGGFTHQVYEPGGETPHQQAVRIYSDPKWEGRMYCSILERLPEIHSAKQLRWLCGEEAEEGKD